jgi:hypothetical protein
VVPPPPEGRKPIPVECYTSLMMNSLQSRLHAMRRGDQGPPADKKMLISYIKFWASLIATFYQDPTRKDCLASVCEPLVYSVIEEYPPTAGWVWNNDRKEFQIKRIDAVCCEQESFIPVIESEPELVIGKSVRAPYVATPPTETRPEPKPESTPILVETKPAPVSPVEAKPVATPAPIETKPTLVEPKPAPVEVRDQKFLLQLKKKNLNEMAERMKIKVLTALNQKNENNVFLNEECCLNGGGRHKKNKPSGFTKSTKQEIEQHLCKSSLRFHPVLAMRSNIWAGIQCIHEEESDFELNPVENFFLVDKQEILIDRPMEIPLNRINLEHNCPEGYIFGKTRVEMVHVEITSKTGQLILPCLRVCAYEAYHIPMSTMGKGQFGDVVVNFREMTGVAKHHWSRDPSIVLYLDISGRLEDEVVVTIVQTIVCSEPKVVDYNKTVLPDMKIYEDLREKIVLNLKHREKAAFACTSSRNRMWVYNTFVREKWNDEYDLGCDYRLHVIHYAYCQRVQRLGRECEKQKSVIPGAYGAYYNIETEQWDSTLVCKRCFGDISCTVMDLELQIDFFVPIARILSKSREKMSFHNYERSVCEYAENVASYHLDQEIELIASRLIGTLPHHTYDGNFWKDASLIVFDKMMVRQMTERERHGDPLGYPRDRLTQIIEWRKSRVNGVYAKKIT